MSNKQVYIASGWFTDNTRRILDRIESLLETIEGLDVYSPRRDGTKLTPDQFGNTETRRKVFQDNVDNIKKADFLVANLDGTDGHLDTGTVWEVGMATALGIPVIAYEENADCPGFRLMGGVSSSLLMWCDSMDNLKENIEATVMRHPGNRTLNTYEHEAGNNKILVIGPDFSEDHDRVNLDVFATVNASDIHTRLVDKPSTTAIGDHADEIFNGIDYMIAVVDDRHPCVAWSMGQAFVRNVPIISFTNHDYGVNLMLLLSIVRHVKGTGKLVELIEEIKLKGIDNLEEVDYADVRAI